MRGFSTLEILLAGALFTIFSWGVISVLLSGLASDRQNHDVTRATYFAGEGMEAARMMARDNFENIHPIQGAGILRRDEAWEWQEDPNDLEGIFTREITIESVKRESGGNIAQEGDDDSDTFHVVVTVTWPASPERDQTIVLQTYITRWRI